MILFAEDGHSAPYIAAVHDCMLQLNTNPTVTLSLAQDEICSACPHHQNALCEKAHEVDESDRKILTYCGLDLGIQLPWADYRQKLIHHILHKDLLAEACEGCRYLPRCEDVSRKNKI